MQMIDRKIMVVLVHCNHRQGKHHIAWPGAICIEFCFLFHSKPNINVILQTNTFTLAHIAVQL